MLFLTPMSFRLVREFFCLLLFSLLSSCAQIVPPQGGAQDVTPPQLLSVSPEDSMLNTKLTRIDLRFDEFITLSNAASEVTVSPILPFPLNVMALKKTVTVKIPDSLLKENTTYRISFGKAIQDVHENNPFTGYVYTFSTGSYFDTLSLEGFIIDAATGRRDSNALVVLHEAYKSDSAIVREKPLYAVKPNQQGFFRFEGLPEKQFKIYAVRDENDNMIYDGAGEMVAFTDSIVTPSMNPVSIRLNLFAEIDTSAQPASSDQNKKGGRREVPPEPGSPQTFNYAAAIDTSDVKKRTADITKTLDIKFTAPFQNFNSSRVNLSYDSLNVSVEADIRAMIDTSENILQLNTVWRENTVYTLRLLKGFVQDTAGNDAMPARYTFRTKRAEDYATLHIHLPAKYFGDGFVFVLLDKDDTVYQRAVTDTMIHFTRLKPGNYSMRIIADKNKNGKWDSGDLLEKIQPEEVIPYLNPITLRANWENLIDFEEENKTGDRPDASPDKRERLRR